MAASPAMVRLATAYELYLLPYYICLAPNSTQHLMCLSVCARLKDIAFKKGVRQMGILFAPKYHF